MFYLFLFGFILILLVSYYFYLCNYPPQSNIEAVISTLSNSDRAVVVISTIGLRARTPIKKDYEEYLINLIKSKTNKEYFVKSKKQESRRKIKYILSKKK